MKQWEPKDITALRNRLKLTQEAFGDLIGVTRTYVNLMEKGVKEPSKTLKVLFSCLDKETKQGIYKMNPQDKREIAIFKKFAQICPHHIVIDSVMKEKPPKPDISCKLSDGNTIAFELVESIDESLSRAFNDAYKINKAFINTIKKMSKEKSKSFNNNFKNASFYISFALGLSSRKKHSLIPIILNHLLTLEKAFEGTVNIHHIQELKKTIRNIHISRGEYIGPLFDIAAGSSFGEPCLKIIRGKFNKKYKGTHDKELLVYYDLQPGVPLDQWLPQVEEYIKNNIRDSAFKRVWLYLVHKEKIIYTYPKNKILMKVTKERR